VAAEGINTLSGKPVELNIATPRERIMNALGGAQNDLKAAYAIAVQANPMAQDVAVFQKIKNIQAQLSEVMLELNKLRGL
jgi:hypothetical protein